MKRRLLFIPLALFLLLAAGAGTKEAQKRIGAELVDIIEHFA